MTFLVFVISLGAALRLTRLSNEDSITQPMRNFLASKESRVARWLSAMVSCPWCSGFWWTAAMIILGWTSHGATWFVLPALILATSYVLGAIYTVVFTLELYEPVGSPNRPAR